MPCRGFCVFAFSVVETKKIHIMTAVALLMAGALGLEPVPREELLRLRRRNMLVGSIMCWPKVGFARDSWLDEVPLATDDFVLRPPRTRSTETDVELSARESLARQIVARAKARVDNRPSRPSREATEVVRFRMRVARSDGTFAVRDDDGGDKPLFGDLDVAVYGDLAPANAALFLRFALGESPGYESSLFDEIAGPILIGGRLRGLEERELFGERILLYRDRELLAGRDDRRLERIAASETTPLRLDRPGLLLRRRAPSPQSAQLLDFGLSLAPAPELDDQWTVFGSVLKDDSRLLDAIKLLPTYSAEAVGNFSNKEYPIAGQVFKAERDLFRAAADAVGDTRLKSIFPGKILRRVEVTRVDLLKPVMASSKPAMSPSRPAF